MQDGCTNIYTNTYTLHTEQARREVTDLLQRSPQTGVVVLIERVEILPNRAVEQHRVLKTQTTGPKTQTSGPKNTNNGS